MTQSDVIDFAKAGCFPESIQEFSGIRVKLSSTDAKMPSYETEGAAGADLCTVIGGILHPGQHRLFPTGLKMEIPVGYEVQIRPRSGLALKHGVTVLNTPGTIDSDYRGEIGIILINHSNTPFNVNIGDRIAQMVVAKVERLPLRQAADVLTFTKRGEGGFGSTGTGSDAA